MSVIIAIATRNKIIVKSDGREMDGDVIVSDNSQKILRIRNTVIGFTGSTFERGKIMRHLVNLYGEELRASAETLYESSRSFCIKNNVTGVITMLVASTQNHTLFLKQFSSIDGFNPIDCLKSKLPVVALAGDIVYPFSTYNPHDIESSMNQYIIKTSNTQRTVGGKIFTEILEL